MLKNIDKIGIFYIKVVFRKLSLKTKPDGLRPSNLAFFLIKCTMIKSLYFPTNLLASLISRGDNSFDHPVPWYNCKQFFLTFHVLSRSSHHGDCGQRKNNSPQSSGSQPSSSRPQPSSSGVPVHPPVTERHHLGYDSLLVRTRVEPLPRSPTLRPVWNSSCTGWFHRILPPLCACVWINHIAIHRDVIR